MNVLLEAMLLLIFFLSVSGVVVGASVRFAHKRRRGIWTNSDSRLWRTFMVLAVLSGAGLIALLG